MNAPTSTQRQVDRANDLHAQLYGNKETPAEAPSEQSDVDIINSLPGAEVAAEPVAEAPVAEETPAEPVEPVAEPEGGDSSPAAPAEAAGTTEDEEKFEQRYSVLKGKYDAEVPRLHTELRGLHEELNSMRNLLSSLEQPTPVETPQGAKLLKDEEVEDYGSDMIDVMKRAAREEFMPLINRLELENEQLRNTLGGVSESVSENARDVLYRALNSEIPNWKEINQNEGFLEWLDGVDPYSGARKGDMLTQAFENNDAARVIAFFKGHLNENVLVSETPTPTNTAPVEPKVDLMSMAAPGAPRGSSTPNAHTDKRVYSHAEIAQFYRNVQKGMYKNNEAEKQAIEKDILAAPREGRLR